MWRVMNPQFWMTIMLAACLTLSPTPSKVTATEQGSEESALRAVMEKFFAAHEKKDLAQMLALWSEKSPDYTASRQAFEKRLAEADYGFTQPEISGITITGEKASLRCRVDLTVTKPGDAEPVQAHWVRNISLVKEGGQWKIARDTSVIGEVAGALVAAKTETDRTAALAAENELKISEIIQIYRETELRVSAQRNFAQGIVFLNLARSLAEKENDSKTLNAILKRLARVLYNNGLLFQMRQDSEQALVNYQESLKVAEGISDKEVIATSSLSIGALQVEQGDLRPAIFNLNRSRETYEEMLKTEGEKTPPRGKEGLVKALHNLGIANLYLGELGEALKHFEMSREINEKVGDKRVLAENDHKIGILYAMQRDYPRAQEYFEKALATFQSLGDPTAIADVSNSLGLLLLNDGKYEEARQNFEKILGIGQAKNDLTLIATATNNLGDADERSGDDLRALERFQKSEEINQKLGSKSGIAHAQLSLSHLMLKLGRHPEALDYAKRSVARAAESNVRDTLWQAHYQAGLAQRALNQPALARQEFLDAISVIEDLRTKVTGGLPSMQRYFEDKTEPYRAMVELASQQNNRDEALKYAEKIKARTLLEIIGPHRSAIDGKAMSEAQQKREKELRDRLYSADFRLALEHQKKAEQQKPALLKELEAAEGKAVRDYEAFAAQLSPKSMVLRGEAPDFSWNDTALLLSDEHHALLEFVTGEEQSFLFVLTRSGRALEWKSYPLRIKGVELAEKIKKVRGLFTGEPTLVFDQPLRDLYETLLRPAQEQLRGKTTLVISPDGPLWEVPFQALMPAENKFLLQDAAIFYVPSLTALREFTKARNRPSNGPLRVLAVGNPSLGGTAETKLVKIRGLEELLAPLPDTEKEVREIQKQYGPGRSQSYLGANADEDVVKAKAPLFDILHFATHGVLDNSNPMSSCIVLSQTGRTEKKDGLLQAWELMEMNLRAKLVVLSACNTALGGIRAGEGVIGLNWALFVAGTPATVVSQWKVNSASTAELMIRFHHELKNHWGKAQSPISIAEALRQASLKVLDFTDARGKHPYQHPYHWAGFILAGNGF